MGQEEEIGQREKLQILLAEYTSLRSEINSRISSTYSAVAVLILLIVFVLQQNVGFKFYIGLFIAVVGTGICGRILAYDTFSAARRVQEIEAEVNRRAKEKLLIWETERGGLNAVRWRSATFASRIKFRRKAKQ